MDVLDTNPVRPSKGLKRRREDDDLLATLQSAVAAADTEDDDNDNDDDDDEYDGIDFTWIKETVQRPVGERGRKYRDDRPGWGKAEAMEVAGITEEQYRRYMVSCPISSSPTQF
jgi:hypothetical protein